MVGGPPHKEASDKEILEKKLAAIESAISKIKQNGYKLAIVVLSNDGKDYPYIKAEAEVRVS